MNIIEKLEALLNANRFAMVNDDCTTTDIVAVSDLRAIIEEYKNAKPIGYIVLTESDSDYEMRMNFYPAAIKEGRVNIGDQVFTHPPLSDETVKDAERYRWLRENMGETNFDEKRFTGQEFPDTRLKFLMPPIISYTCVGEQISLDAAIDEAMKAES